MQKISMVLFSSLCIFPIALSLQANDPFSEYDIVMEEREFDTEEFDWNADVENDDEEDPWEESYDSDLHFSDQKRNSNNVSPINYANAGDPDTQATDQDTDQTHLDVEPTSIVNQVNVITGCYMDSEVDFVIPGAEPFILQRNYVSCGTDERSPLGKGWNRNYFGFIERKKKDCRAEAEYAYEVTVLESGGAMYRYGGMHRFELEMVPGSYKYAVTNCGSGFMCGRTNIRNNLLNYEERKGRCKFLKSTGENLTFKQYKHYYNWRLSHELKPNGNQLDYTYLKNNKLGTLACRNSKGKPLGELNFEYGKTKESRVLKGPFGINLEDLCPTGSEFIFITSGGKRVATYRLEHLESKKKNTAPYIVEVVRENGPRVTYQYEDMRNNARMAKIVRVNKPDGRFREIEYYTVTSGEDVRFNRVMQQKAPVGQDATPVITHRYVYKKPVKSWERGRAQVYDAYNHKTNYFWNDEHRLEHIMRYSGTKAHTLYSLESLYWGRYGDDYTFLLGRTMRNEDNKIQYMRAFSYDRSGNVVKDSLFGNLTGNNSVKCKWDYDSSKPVYNGCEYYSKHFTYTGDARNLMTSMTEGKVEQTFQYKDGTDLLEAKFFSTDGTIFKREFYTYDKNAVLIKKIEDDGDLKDPDNLHGATERHIRIIRPRDVAPIGLPDVIEEKYVDVKTGKKHLLKRMVHHYDKDGRLCAKDLFDANNAYICTFKWKYDAHGNLIEETNPLGQTTIRNYDANDNKIYEQGPNPNLHKEFTYDFSNRLVRADEIHTNGLTLSESYIYNYLSQKIGMVDIYGNETSYEYDDFGRQTKTKLPPVLSSNGLGVFSDYKEYNLYNAPKVIKDFRGNTTTMEYNIRAKPTLTVFADGSMEKMLYNLDGTICKHTHKNGSYTSYKYDHLKRVISKATYGPDGKKLEYFNYSYNTFHLLEEKDTAGHIKSYGYDAAGRLNEVVDGEKRMTYEYDSIGRLYKTIEYDGHGDFVCSIQLFDLLDRVIEEKREDSEGNLLTRVTYDYDVDGNLTTVTNYSEQGASTSTTIYDDRHQPIQVIDALGNTTHLHYKYDFRNEHGQIVPYSESVDPMGNITENIKDAQGRLVKLILRDSFGQMIHSKEFRYDRNGNKSYQYDTSYRNGKKEAKVKTKWTHDCMNRVKTITEAVGKPEQRHTEFIYNAFGEKSQIIKPDGVKIDFTYDHLGRVVNQTSTDGTINYHCHYDRKGHLESVKDRVHKLNSSCIHDDFDRVKSETLLNGLTIGYRYDKANRPKVITFPDGTAVQYVYNAHRLTEVHRLSSEKQRKYSHRYTSYDTEDKLLEAKLVGKAGNATYQYDLVGRTTAVLYRGWQEEISSYDKVGNILMRELTDVLGKLHCSYKYDDLYQLKTESEVLAQEENQPQKHMDERTYAHNSFYNRVSKEGVRAQFNKLNQLLNDGKYDYQYDPNGNLICRKTVSPTGSSEQSLEGNGSSENLNASLDSPMSEEMTLEYDALDRLIAVSEKNKKVGYLYDANNRRMVKRIQERTDVKEPWKTVSEVKYIYIGQNEIGSYDENGTAIELRLLGLSKGAEIGAAVAVELYGEVYTPLHDHQGNVTALVDAKSGKIAESYRYTAFGEEQIFDAEGNQLEASANPWRFSSKRFDNETGFVYFGRRYYEPASARWITPDPIGREGGPNLYAYVMNRTLTHSDLYGLYGMDGGGYSGYNLIEGALNWTATFLNDVSRCVGATMRYVGRTMDTIGYHLVPIPIVRDVMQIGGRILSGQGFNDYHFTFFGKNTYGELGLPELSPTLRNAMIGGIGTYGEDMIQRAKEESARLKGNNVHYCATSSDGIILDFLKAGLRCCGISFPGDQHIVDFLSKCNNSMEGPQDQRKILLDVHSQGAIMSHNAIDKLGAICRSMDVFSYGGAKILNPNNFNSVKTYISERDIIPLVSNPASYIFARFCPRSDVIFLKSNGLPLVDHFWDGDTYQNVIIKSSDDKKNMMGLK